MLTIRMAYSSGHKATVKHYIELLIKYNNTEVERIVLKCHMAALHLRNMSCSKTNIFNILECA